MIVHKLCICKRNDQTNKTKPRDDFCMCQSEEVEVLLNSLLSALVIVFIELRSNGQVNAPEGEEGDQTDCLLRLKTLDFSVFALTHNNEDD